MKETAYSWKSRIKRNPWDVSRKKNIQLRLEIHNFKKEVLERVQEENKQLEKECKSFVQDLIDTQYKLHTVSRDHQQDKQRIRDLQKQNEQLKTVTSEIEELRQTKV